MFINFESFIYLNYYSLNFKMFYRLELSAKNAKMLKYQNTTSVKSHF